MIGIIDYGMGNLRSVQKALERVGGDAVSGDDLSERRAGGQDRPARRGGLRRRDGRPCARAGLVEPLVRAIGRGVPYLGFCLGLQLLFDVSYEDGQHTGLGVLAGKVVRFQLDASVTAQRLSVPHMGWNQIRWRRDVPMLTRHRAGRVGVFRPQLPRGSCR